MGKRVLYFRASAALTPLSAPANGQATGTSPTEINVAASSVANATGYKLYTSTTSGGTYTQIGGTLSTPAYTHTGLTASTAYYYKWQALGNGTTYADSPLGAAFSGTTQTPTSGYNIVLTGNSNVEGTYGHSIMESLPGFLSSLVDATVTNKGIGGSDIQTMQNRFAADVTNTYVPGKRNILVGMEGTNSLRGSETVSAYDTKVKAYLLQAKNAGFEIIWLGTMPNTIAPGTSVDSNPAALTTNAGFAGTFSGLGYMFGTLTTTLIGHFGTAAWGGDSGYSSFGVASGSTVAGNRFYVEGTHLTQIGYDVLARKTADYILNLINGTVLPDRTLYGAPTGPVAQLQDFIHGVNVETPTLGEVKKTNFDSSFTGGACSVTSIGAVSGAAAGTLVGYLETEVHCLEAFFGGQNNPSDTTTFTDMPYAVYLNAASLDGGTVQYWRNGSPLTGNITTYTYGDVVRLAFYPDKVELLLNNTLIYTDSVAPSFPVCVDVSLSGIGNSFKNVKVLATTPVPTA